MERGVILVDVYMDDGRVFCYEVVDQHKAREHAAAIVRDGYRHCDGNGGLEHYPPHRILKVKLNGGIETDYPDKVRGT
jgi:hypothetical protein